MQLSDKQAIITRLYTDTTFRRDYIADKEFFYKKNNIVSKEVIEFIEGIAVDQLVFYAKSLIAKRMHETNNLLPLSYRFIGKKAGDLFLEFAETYQPSGIHKHHDDAVQFIHFLLKKNTTEHTKTDRFIWHLLHYELELIHNFTTPKKYRLAVYHYDFLKNYALLLKNTKLIPLPRKRTIVVWKNRKPIKIW